MNVLVLCTGNSARSVLGEVLLRELAGAAAFSAGSRPTGRVNPEAVAVLERHGHDASGVASRSWDAFEDGPEMDVVVTVCDSAAAEECPWWPGAPVRVHWGIPDPAGAEDEPAAFEAAYRRMRARVEVFAALDLASMDAAGRQSALALIGEMPL